MAFQSKFVFDAAGNEPRVVKGHGRMIFCEPFARSTPVPPDERRRTKVLERICPTDTAAVRDCYPPCFTYPTRQNDHVIRTQTAHPQGNEGLALHHPGLFETNIVELACHGFGSPTLAATTATDNCDCLR